VGTHGTQRPLFHRLYDREDRSNSQERNSSDDGIARPFFLPRRFHRNFFHLIFDTVEHIQLPGHSLEGPAEYSLSPLSNPQHNYAASERVAADRISYFLKYELVAFCFWGDICDNGADTVGISTEGHAGPDDKRAVDVHLYERISLVP